MDWSGLGSDLIAEVAGRLQLLEDFIALRGVCRSWRAAGNRGFGSKSGTAPLLLLNDKYQSDDWELYSIISKRRVYRKLSLPTNARPSYAGFGWFIMKDRSRKVISLFDPFSGATIILPYSYDSGNLSANPSDTSNFVLMNAMTGCVCFWRPGDSDWTRAPIKNYKEQINNYCYCNGKFYAIDRAGNVWVLDPDRITQDHSSARFITKLPQDMYLPNLHLYLVGSSDGKLIYITREFGVNLVESTDEDNFKRYEDFKLYHIDVVKGEWQEISGLNEDAVFIDSNTSFCVPASAHIKSNCIYFTRCPYYGVYNIRDGSYEFFGVRANRTNWVHSSSIFNTEKGNFERLNAKPKNN